MLPPTLNSAASPLIDGDDTPCAIQNEIPSHGDGEQSTNFGGPCPNWLHPPLPCTCENVFPVLCDVGFVVGGFGLGGLGLGGFAAAALATVICNPCSFESPLESVTETSKLKLPLAVGVPEIVPVLPPRTTPAGN